MFTRKRLVVAGSGVLLAVVLVAGSALAAPSPQTPSGQGQTNYRQVFIDKLAALLGTTSDKLTSAAKQAANDTVDQAQKDGALTADQATNAHNRINSGNGSNFFSGPGFMQGRGGRGMQGWFFGGQAEMDAIAKALGMTTADLQTQLKSGKTIADLAKEKNVTADQIKTAVVDAVTAQANQAVKDGKLTQTQADNIINKVKNTSADTFLNIGARKGPWGVSATAVEDAVAKVLGLNNAADLRAQIKSGKTIADLAKEKNVTADQIKTAVVDAVTAQVNQAVKDGKLTQTQADNIINKVKNVAADNFLNVGGRGWMGLFGGQFEGRGGFGGRFFRAPGRGNNGATPNNGTPNNNTPSGPQTRFRMPFPGGASA